MTAAGVGDAALPPSSLSFSFSSSFLSAKEMKFRADYNSTPGVVVVVVVVVVGVPVHFKNGITFERFEISA